MTALARFAPRPLHVLIGVGGAFVLLGIFVAVVYARTTIPSPSAIASAQVTTIYYSDGKTKLATLGTTTRVDVPLSAVPLTVQHAVLAAEDRHFYSEPGISPTGIMRALFDDIRGGDISQGGSTITQQYAKNAYLSQQRSFTRKLKEIVIATKLGQSRSKSSILDDYLNTIYFGRNAYGIAAAARAYFHEPVGQLTAAQGALLAAVIRGPSLYDPRQNPTAAQQRWQYVINGMVSQNWLSKSQANSLQFPKTVKVPTGRSSCQGTLCFIRDAVRVELTAQDGFTADQLAQGGYKVVTTIDRQAQSALDNAEHSVLPTQNAQTESGAASVKPGDGAIEALYGGATYCHNTKHNKDACLDLSGASGSQMGAPSGSSMKTFTLIAALKQGIALTSTFDGPPSVDVDGSIIHNSSYGESCYGCTLLNAYARSINTIFVPLAKQVGPSKVDTVAHDAGIPSYRHLADVPDVTLGPDRISPLDLASAYATVAAQGMQADPYLVKSVTTTHGDRIYKAKPKTHRVFSASVMSEATFAMTKVLQTGGTAAGHALASRPSAGKTGTTDNNSNAWFTGFTPQLCTSVWIGNVSRTKPLQIVGGGGEVFGGTYPAEIWQSMMTAALANAPVEQFPTPIAVGTPVFSATPTATKSATSTPTATKSATPTATASATPTVTPTKTLTPPGSSSPSPTKHAVPGANPSKGPGNP